jgi:hypothetical protein
MHDIELTGALLSQGYNHDDLRRLQQRSDLVRVRRGAYARDGKPDLPPEERHRRLVLATAAQHGTTQSSVTVRRGAARPAGLANSDRRVHVTRSRSGSGRKRNVVQVHGAPCIRWR